MEDDALVGLAAMTVSRTRALLFGCAVVVIVFLIAMSIQASNIDNVVLVWLMRLGLVAIIVSLNWVRKIRPSVRNVPTLRCMRDRPNEIHAIVGVERGSHYLAVTGRDGALLARPMEIVNTGGAVSLDDVVPSYRSDTPTSTTLTTALGLAATACPHAKIVTARDNVGVRSLAALVRKATAVERAGASHP